MLFLTETTAKKYAVLLVPRRNFYPTIMEIQRNSKSLINTEAKIICNPEERPSVSFSSDEQTSLFLISASPQHKHRFCHAGQEYSISRSCEPKTTGWVQRVNTADHLSGWVFVWPQLLGGPPQEHFRYWSSDNHHTVWSSSARCCAALHPITAHRFQNFTTL